MDQLRKIVANTLVLVVKRAYFFEVKYDVLEIEMLAYYQTLPRPVHANAYILNIDWHWPKEC